MPPEQITKYDVHLAPRIHQSRRNFILSTLCKASFIKQGDGWPELKATPKVLEKRACEGSRMYKRMSRSRSFSEKMDGIAPLAIGTRGTVGSLVMKEIEYFTKFEVERHGSSQRISGDASRRSDCKGSFWLVSLTWKWKKRKGNNGILPNICSAVELSKSNRFNGIPGFSYRILKHDFPI